MLRWYVRRDAETSLGQLENLTAAAYRAVLQKVEGIRPNLIALGASALSLALASVCPAAAGDTARPLVIAHPTAPMILADEQRAFLDHINAFRVRHGVDPVAVDDRLTEAALIHARDMAERRYFGNESPEGTSLIDRLQRVGFTWRVAAENIALDEDEPHAHDALLKRTAERANVLDPRVRSVGIAALRIGERNTLYVVDFAL